MTNWLTGPGWAVYIIEDDPESKEINQIALQDNNEDCMHHRNKEKTTIHINSFTTTTTIFRILEFFFVIYRYIYIYIIVLKY